MKAEESHTAESRSQDDVPSDKSAASDHKSPAETARDASRQLASGFAAVRDVRQASKRHAVARAQARSMRRDLAADEQTLAHRKEVETSYERIVAEQTESLNRAEAEAAEARQEKERLSIELQELKERLTALKVSNEDALRPYRNLLETTRSRSDAAAVALAEARRAVKSADGRMSEAVRNRDQRMKSANRAVDGAQGRLYKAEGELERLQGEEGASSAMIDRLRSEVASERSAVASAKSDVAQVSGDAQLAVDNAQTHLWTARQSLEVAERQAEAAKQEASASRSEYDALYKKAKTEESEMEEAIKEHSRSIEAADLKMKEAEARAQQARALLIEAKDIVSTPELTRELEHRVNKSHAELERREREVGELSRQEKGLRARTRHVRLSFFAVLMAVLLLLALIVWLILPR